MEVKFTSNGNKYKVTYIKGDLYLDGVHKSELTDPRKLICLITGMDWTDNKDVYKVFFDLISILISVAHLTRTLVFKSHT